MNPATKTAILTLAADASDLSDATEVAVQRCMTKAGYHYRPTLNDPARASQANLGGIVGLRSVAQASSQAYSDLVERSRGQESPQTAYLASLSDDMKEKYSRALDDDMAKPESIQLDSGVVVSAASSGCLGEAQTKIYGSVVNYLRLTYLGQEIQDAVGDVRDSAAVRAASDAYGVCMREAGIEVDSLKEAVALATERFADREVAQQPSAAERAMAVSDATCQEKAGLATATNEEIVSRAASWITAHESDIVALTQVRKDSLARARAVLRSGS